MGDTPNFSKQNNSRYTKQFHISPRISQADWIFSKSSASKEIYITPANNTKSVYINKDLIVSGKIYNNSDINHMEQIVPISDSKIEKIFDLEPIEYKLKGDIKNNILYGLIAQDVEKVFPELVNDNNLALKTVNNMDLIPLLLLKMKKMQNEIDELKESNKMNQIR
jgi:hypothetical protein